MSRNTGYGRPFLLAHMFCRRFLLGGLLAQCAFIHHQGDTLGCAEDDDGWRGQTDYSE